MIGERINNYEIVSVLGEGGMGSVFLAEHPFMGRKAAIKVLRPELARDTGLVERFMNEARAANAIRHPNIIDIIDVGRLANGVPYLMMEYLEGESVKDRLDRQRPMPVGEALEVAEQTASALAAAHEKTIVHRDLKPDNLYLIPDRAHPLGRIKVLDFGIAKLRGELSGSGARTQTGSIMGTPPYMSPEQCRGVDELDHRTDIYALGIILYEMLTGAPPFVSPGWGEVVHMHITETPSPLRAKNPAVSPELERLVLKALAKKPADRWSSMGELEAALRAIPGHTTLAPARPARVSAPSAARSSAAPSPPTTLRSATGQVTAAPEALADGGGGGSGGSVGMHSGRSRMRLPALVVGGIAVAGIAFAVVSRRTPEPDAVVVPASTSAPVPAPAAAPALAAAPAPIAPPPPAPTPVAIPAAPAPVAPPTRPAADAVRAAPATTPAKKKAVSSKASRKAGASETPPAAPAETSPPPAPPPAAAKKPDCNPNYYFDAQARKHFKPECF